MPDWDWVCQPESVLRQRAGSTPPYKHRPCQGTACRLVTLGASGMNLHARRRKIKESTKPVSASLHACHLWTGSTGNRTSCTHRAYRVARTGAYRPLPLLACPSLPGSAPLPAPRKERCKQTASSCRPLCSPGSLPRAAFLPSPPQGARKAGESPAPPPWGGRKTGTCTAENPGAFSALWSPPSSIHQAQPPALCQCNKESLQPLACPSPQPQGCPRAAHGVAPEGCRHLGQGT